ncbi:MAG: Unknown protein [uncultured Sulfurovum sp.]|uniref:Uncharacterized protein n=1 Tax=uncultured Sulfurovum sp. TaxID=269237 RepID=A0A6S6UCV1_9BACT|nr:MAG: Unknown protein [uncultured Sulfurovum sp.]
MTKTIAGLILFCAMLINLNATEVPTQNKDTNCSVEKCKTKKSSENNCTVEKCKTIKKTHCSKGKRSDSNQTTPTWSLTKDGNSSIKSPSCCKNKNKETNKEVPTKCNAGKCGGK